MLATCAHASFPARRTPVSSLCSTGARRNAAVSAASTGASVAAACWIQRTSVPRPSRTAEEVGEQALHASQRQQLLLHQIDRQGTQLRSVLRAAGRHGREGADTHPLAHRTAHVQRLILGDPQPHRRQLVYLSALPQHDRHRVCERGLAVRTDGWPLLHELIGRRHQMQRLPTMPQLPARLLATLFAQTLRPALQPVTARAACRCCGCPWPRAPPTPAHGPPRPSAVLAARRSQL